jgi:hypothetical protein
MRGNSDTKRMINSNSGQLTILYNNVNLFYVD